MAEFIDITEPRSPLGTENILRPYKRGEAEITVDVCTGVLRGTNFARSIRDMLGCVEKIPQEKMPEFREIILSVFCGREQPDDMLELGAKMAAAAGCASELTALPKDIEVPVGESGGRMCLMSAPVKRRGLDLTVSEGDYHFNNVDFGAYDRLCVYPRPDSYGTGWKTVTFDGCKNFPKETDFSRVRYILFDHCRLESVSGYKFSRDCEVRFGGFAPVDGLPADRDFWGLKKVYFDCCRYEEGDAKPLFSAGVCAHIARFENFPLETLTEADEVYFTGMDFQGCRELPFKEGAALAISGSSNMGTGMIDCKRYRRIKLYALRTLPEGTVFSFRKGASVSLNTIPLPETMDFANCAALEIKDCDWSAVRNVDFADEAQYKRYRNELPDAAEVRYGGWKESVLQKWRRRFAGR